MPIFELDQDVIKTIILKITANERTSQLFDELSRQQLTLIADSALLACDEEVSEEIIPAMSWEPSVIAAADDMTLCMRCTMT